MHPVKESPSERCEPPFSARLASTGFVGLVLLGSGACGSISQVMTRGDEPDDLASERLGQAVYRHEGNYIIAGGSPDTSAKYQLSLKVRMARRVFFGYSQTNLWDISRASSPFRDTTHRPSFFYYGVQRDFLADSGYRHIYGLEHNSNGRDEGESRSLNQLFYQPELILGQSDRRQWRLSAKAYAYVGKGDNNRNINDFRSNFELWVRNTEPGGANYAVWWRPGKGGRGSGAAQFSTGLRRLGWNVPGSLMIELFAGYGETLLDYDLRQRPQLRIGYRLE